MNQKFSYVFLLIFVLLLAISVFVNFNSISSPIFRSFAKWVTIGSSNVVTDQNSDIRQNVDIPAMISGRYAISGVYPHLAVFGSSLDAQYDENGRFIYSELGIGAISKFNNKLWLLTYPSHSWRGGNNKLYAIDLTDMKKIARPESVGGTHAGKFYNSGNNKLILGPYIIDSQDKVKAISPDIMPGRITGIAPHLTDKNKVYVYTMEQGLYSLDVNTYAVQELHKDNNALLGRAENYIKYPLVQGSHGKDIFTVLSGSVLLANNGKDAYPGRDIKIGGLGENVSGHHLLGDSTKWNLLESTNFNDIESSTDMKTLWMLGWDSKSVIVKTRRNSTGTQLRFPKAFQNYHAVHGWSTEWPRIMKLSNDSYLANLYGSYYEWTDTFGSGVYSNIIPKTTHLKTVNDIVKVNDTTYAVAGNDLSIGKASEKDITKIPSSNLEFLNYSEITNSGQRFGDGAILLNENLSVGKVSDPFFIGGYSERTIHFKNASTSQRLIISVEVSSGNNVWTEVNRVVSAPGAYTFFILPENIEYKWVRLVSQSNTNNVTAYVFLETPELLNAENSLIFNPLIDIEGSETGGNRGVFAPTDQSLEYVSIGYNSQNQRINSSLYSMGSTGIDGETTDEIMNMVISTDSSRAASIESTLNNRRYTYTNSFGYVTVYDSNSNPYALPITERKYSEMPPSSAVSLRRLLSDTYVLNAYGTFYTVPEDTPGSEGIINIRPIVSHSKIISDFNIWRGMLVLAGTKANVEKTSHYFTTSDGSTGLWFGRVDDLYKFKKPKGYITFWDKKNTTQGEMSLPLLISGYSQKSLFMSHNSGSDRKFEILVSFTPRKNPSSNNLPYFHKYGEFTVRSGERFTYNFPKGFNARWIRIKSINGTTNLTGSLSLNGLGDPNLRQINNTGEVNNYSPVQSDMCDIYRWDTSAYPGYLPEALPPKDVDSVLLPDGRLKITLLNNAGTGIYVRYYYKSGNTWIPHSSGTTWAFRVQDLPVPGVKYRSYDHVLFPNNILKQSAIVDNAYSDFYYRYLTWNSTDRSWAIGDWYKSSPDSPYGADASTTSIHYLLNKSGKSLKIKLKRANDTYVYYRWLNWDATKNTWKNEPPYLTDVPTLNWYSSGTAFSSQTPLRWDNLRLSEEDLKCLE